MPLSNWNWPAFIGLVITGAFLLLGVALASPGPGPTGATGETATPISTPPPGTPGPTPPPSASTPISPTRFDDPSPDTCQPNDCSLREAIIAANENVGSDTIALGAGQYNVDLVYTRDGTDFTLPIRISDDTTIVGLGADRTLLDGERIGGVFEIYEDYPSVGFAVHIADLAIQDGLGPVGGGAIYAHSGVSLTISRVSMTGNGGGARGGAILSWGAVTITDSTIADNWAVEGGAVYGGDPLTIANSTISGNEGTSSNGGISSGNATLTNVTITGNTPVGLSGSGLRVQNSIIVGNGGNQCWGIIASLGHNLFGDNSCGSGPGDIVLTDPMLGPLSDNGGPTQTHALLASSPAIDAGDNAACPPADQRGYSRVGACDIGAFEYVPPATPAPTPKPVVVTATPTPTLSPTVASGTPTPSPSPSAKPSPSRTPLRSQTPSPEPKSVEEEGGGGSGGMIIGLALGGLAVVGAGGGGGYYLWKRSAVGLRLWPPWS